MNRREIGLLAGAAVLVTCLILLADQGEQHSKLMTKEEFNTAIERLETKCADQMNTTVSKNDMYAVRKSLNSIADGFLCMAAVNSVAFVVCSTMIYCKLHSVEQRMNTYLHVPAH